MASTPSQAAPPPRLGWIGLGSMGLAMALNLQTHLRTTSAPGLVFFNRTASRGEALGELGGVAAASVADLVAETDVAFLSLSDDAALTQMLDALLQDAARDLAGKIVVDTSTVSASCSAAAQVRLAARGVRFVAAPVFGASPVAAEGRLLWVVAGPDDAVGKIEPYIVGVMGRGVIRLGEDVTKASMLKTTGNFLTAGMMELVAEAHVLAEKTSLPAAVLESLLEQQYGPLAHSISRRLTTGAYVPARGSPPWSDLGLALKDVGLGVGAAERAGARLEVGELVMRHLRKAEEYGEAQGRRLDSAALYGAVRAEAGLEFENEAVKERDGGAAS
ncbi:hypothetical protein S40293_01511 [Stachybotrys chartarum IBT 40293]|nr:hypothetical protein S40293_01511 [Stachybotrys chartarum IBT 40293]